MPLGKLGRRPVSITANTRIMQLSWSVCPCTTYELGKKRSVGLDEQGEGEQMQLKAPKCAVQLRSVGMLPQFWFVSVGYALWGSRILLNYLRVITILSPAYEG